jgi:hypothetical protein
LSLFAILPAIVKFVRVLNFPEVDESPELAITSFDILIINGFAGALELELKEKRGKCGSYLHWVGGSNPPSQLQHYLM